MKKDSIFTGVWVSLASILLTALVIFGVFAIFGIPFNGNLKFFLAAFVPAILLLRYYAKNLHFMHTATTISVVLFLLVVAFIIFLVRSNEIAMG
ncbi:MAG: hypothetical protein IK032_07245 [Bacteroidales bacterium]|nr:hypothetical protein [Bacteroidales bacterium]